MKKFFLVISSIFLFSCNDSSTNKHSNDESVKTLASSSVPDSNLISLNEISVIKTNLNNTDVSDFDKENQSGQFACDVNTSPVDSRVAMGDSSVEQTISIHVADINGAAYTEQFKNVITVTDISKQPVSKERQKIDLQVDGTTEFDYCGIDQENSFVESASSIVNIQIENKKYTGLLYKTSVKGQVFCLRNNADRTRINLGSGTKEGRSIYFHQLIDLNAYNYHCKGGGQKWFHSSTIKLDSNGAIVATEFNKLTKAVIKN